MSEKRTILDNLVTHLKTIDGTTSTIAGCPFSPYTYKTNISSNVFPKLKFLTEINDFPSVCVYQDSPEIRQELGGETFAYTTMLLRCLFMDDGAPEQSDDFLEDIQYALNSFKYSYIDSNLIDLRILQVSSDEGLLNPYGVLEVSFLVAYKLTV